MKQQQKVERRVPGKHGKFQGELGKEMRVRKIFDFRRISS